MKPLTGLPRTLTPTSGGVSTPFKFRIPLAAPCLCGHESQYVQEVISSGAIGAGEWVDVLETIVAERVGMPYAVAVSSGTAALHLAMLALGVNQQGRVIIPSMTFIATANAAHYCGARPIFTDVDITTGNMDIIQVAGYLEQSTSLAGSGQTQALVSVDLLGYPCDITPIGLQLEEMRIPVIQDCAQSLGAIGPSWGVVKCYSFNANKVVTGGGGGMVVTSSAEIATRVRLLADQGRDRAVQHEYIYTATGYNYRMSNVQAAIALAQMESLEKHLAMKRRIYDWYKQGLKDYTAPIGSSHDSLVVPTRWLTAMRVMYQQNGKESLIHHLRSKGIEAQAVYKPLHLSNTSVGWGCIGASNAERLWHETVCLPSGAGLVKEQVDEVIYEVMQWWER